MRLLAAVLALAALAGCSDIEATASPGPATRDSLRSAAPPDVTALPGPAARDALRPVATLPPAAPPTTGCAYEAQIRAAFPNDGDWAVSVAWRESRCQPDAVNRAETCAPGGSHAMGLFQMCYPLHAPTFAAAGCSDPLEPSCGIAAAAALYAGSGRSPWRLG